MVAVAELTEGRCRRSHRQPAVIGSAVNAATSGLGSRREAVPNLPRQIASIEPADMALIRDDFGKMAEAICLGHRTVRVIQANIAFALGVKSIFLALDLTGMIESRVSRNLVSLGAIDFGHHH